MTKEPTSHSKLGEFFSTAICGNDILSSALYVSGIAILFAGGYAPIALLIVGLVLLLYRTVYREVVEALPMNGGAYNALLNSAAKPSAALAGIMTILSYVATAVISAKTAVEYLSQFIVQGGQAFGFPISDAAVQPWIIPAVIVILLLFAFLVASGVSESAKVAAGIFVFHIFTLAAFIVVGIVFILTHGSVNNTAATQVIVEGHTGLLPTLFLAFSASLLGVSGFESSANFVEEQKHGVFKKTLRNMTVGVLIFNPVIAFILLRIFPIADISAAKDFVIAQAAVHIGGVWFLGWIAINAFLVLCGAVLTSFIGVSGLVHRMTIDDCLPHILINEKVQGPQKRIIFTFFALCTSILLLTHGSLLSLAGVYTISFLSVMTLFAIGNLILRRTRADLKRPYVAPLPLVILAAIATASGIAGNIALDKHNVLYFLTYFIPAAFITLSIIYRRDLYDFAKKLFRWLPPVHRFFEGKSREVRKDHVFAFVHSNQNIARILNYIHRNENARHVTLLHCEEDTDRCSADFDRLIAAMKEAGFFPQMEIDSRCLKNEFGPEVIHQVSTEHGVGKNKLFIGSIHDSHAFSYEELGGARIIL